MIIPRAWPGYQFRQTAVQGMLWANPYALALRNVLPIGATPPATKMKVSTPLNDVRLDEPI